MHRLNGLDTRWLDWESPTRPMHTLKIPVLQPPAGYSFDAIRETIGRRLVRVPPLRWRLAVPPLGVGRPAWVEDAELDLDFSLLADARVVPDAWPIADGLSDALGELRNVVGGPTRSPVRMPAQT